MGVVGYVGVVCGGLGGELMRFLGCCWLVFEVV